MEVIRAFVAKIIFVTGTDTGVGKTVLTGLLLMHLRQNKIHALAMKPFCSGGREDVNILQKLQPGELSDEEMNPFYFHEPLSPYAASKKAKTEITLDGVVGKIGRLNARCEVLLIEGAGGVMVPLGENFLIRDLIIRLRAKVLIAGTNKLGIINHALLTILALDPVTQKPSTLVLMSPAKNDFSAHSNEKTLRKFSSCTNVFILPFLGKDLLRRLRSFANQKKIKKTLAAIIGSV
ncbi:MAG: dethiobiotin synthase [Verrucomicrobiota bacterium]